VEIQSGLVSKMSDSFNDEDEIDIPEDVLAAASEEEEATLISIPKHVYWEQRS